MTSPVTRRSLLRAAPALAAPMALLPASTADAAAETPILSLYRQWAPIRASMVDPLVPNDLSDAHMAALYPLALDLEARIEPLPVSCIEDLAAKVSALATDEDGRFSSIPQSVVDESRALLSETAGAPAAFLPVPPADPLPALLAERERLEQAWLALPSAAEGTLEERAAWEAFLQAEDAIEATVATTPEGILAQFAYIKASYCSGPHDPGRAELSDEIPLAFLDVITEGVRRIGR